MCNNKTTKSFEHKVTIIGESHLRGNALRLGNCLNTNFEVIRLSKPGANLYLKKNAYFN